MIGVDEALRLVLDAAAERGVTDTEDAPLQETDGRVIGEAVAADRDMPPFTRSAMDGYALRASDIAGAPCSLRVIEVVAAGSVPRRRVGPGQASKIMTGAAIPDGADAVQMVENTEPEGEDGVRVLSAVEPGANIRRAGEDLRVGEVLLEAGAILDPVGIALLASAGRGAVRVHRRPRVAILPTGDELVPPGRDPAPAQIRESNGQCLAALVRRAGGAPRLLPIARDTREDLDRAIEDALAGSDVVLVSGGVSMGDFDLVGEALAQAGCRPVFERVAIQPGKPLFFGRVDPGTLVFGLPGNPVSTVVDFLVFARPALRRIGGARAWSDPVLPARLEAAVTRRPGRRAYLPARLSRMGDEMSIRLLPSMGSADTVALSRGNALAIIPEDAGRLEAGSMVSALPMDLR